MEAFSIENGVLRCPEDLNGVPPKELKCWCEKLLDFLDRVCLDYEV